jgi:hypothetical protein
MFSIRFFGHPDEETTSRYYELVLDSLLKSKDLELADNTYYGLSSQGLTTLSAYEEEERRHRDNVRVQALIGVLTFATVAVAIWQEYHPDPPALSEPAATAQPASPT